MIKKLSLYICNFSKHQISFIYNKNNHYLNIAYDYEKKKITNLYFDLHPKTNLIEVINNNGVLNETKFHVLLYYEKQLTIIKEIGYLSYVAQVLFLNKYQAEKFISYEVTISKDNFKNSIEDFINKRMYKSEQQIFRNFILSQSIIKLTRSDRQDKMSFTTINNRFKALTLPYILESKQDKDRKSNYFNQTYWLLTKSE